MKYLNMGREKDFDVHFHSGNVISMVILHSKLIGNILSPRRFAKYPSK